MRNIIICSGFVIAIALVLNPIAARAEVDSTATAPRDSISWNDYTSGLILAASSDKPILLFFHRDSCPYCRKLIGGALTDSTLIRYINSNFIPISVNSESRHAVISDSRPMTEAQLAKEWASTAVPAIWLLEPDGCRIKKLVGLKACTGMMTSLQEVRDKTYGECPNAPLVKPKIVTQPDSVKKTN